MKKRILATTLLLSAACCFTAYAGSWKQTDQGWWWQRDDATYPANGWEWIDANRDGISECYYFDENGYCLLSQTTPDGYQVNADGAWIQDGTVMTKATDSAVSEVFPSEVPMKPWAKDLFDKTIDEIDIHNELYPRGENWDEHTSGSYLFTTCRESWHKYAYDGSSRRIIAYVANLSQLLDYEFDVLTPDALKETLHAKKVEYIRINVSRDGHFIQTMAPGANTSNVCRFVSDNGYTFEVAQTSYDDIRSYCYCLVYKTGTFSTNGWYVNQ